MTRRACGNFLAHASHREENSGEGRDPTIGRTDCRPFAALFRHREPELRGFDAKNLPVDFAFEPQLVFALAQFL